MEISRRQGRREMKTKSESPGGGDADRISDLPDAILGEIISRVPTKDGARTQILASRWRHIWRSAPLNLTLRCSDDHRGSELAAVISRILSTHQGPALRFCVPEYFAGDRLAAIDTWLASPALDNLQELDLLYGVYSPSLPPLPPSFSRFLPTLRVATIGHSHLADGAVQGLHFPHLKQLALDEVKISEDSLHNMIAGCPLLEYLLINNSFGFSRVKINSLTLRSISLHVGFFEVGEGSLVWELIIDNAPSLRRFLHRDHSGQGLRVSVMFAPKLETLGFRYDQPKLFTIIQGLCLRTLNMVLRTVKIVAVHKPYLSLDMVTEFMRCFPSMEKLYIQRYSSGQWPSNLWRRGRKNLMRSLDIRLKTIVVEFYEGTKSDVNFVTFFVLNARVLESMTLQVQTHEYNPEFLAEQHRKLQLEKRASEGAQFHFTTDESVRDFSDITANDLDLTDPFIHRR